MSTSMYYTAILFSNLHFLACVVKPTLFIEFDIFLIAI